MSIWRRLFGSKTTQQNDQSFCQETKAIFQKHFGDFLNANGYSLTFLGRRGRYDSECLFAAEAPELPRLVFGGEIGPDLWLAAPDSDFAGVDSDTSGDWFSIGPLSDFVLGHGPKWLDRAGVSVPFDSGSAVISATLSEIWPDLTRMFRNQEVVDEWRPKFEAFANDAVNSWFANPPLDGDG